MINTDDKARIGRSIIQAVLSYFIFACFTANSRDLSCTGCESTAVALTIVAAGFFGIGTFSLVTLYWFINSQWKSQSENGKSNTLIDKPGIQSWMLKSGFDVCSLFFLFILALAVVVTDGILESCLSGLLTVSIIYSIGRSDGSETSLPFRIAELIIVLIVVIYGEIALTHHYFGQEDGYRSAAAIFDGSFWSKLMGYVSFTISFGVIVTERSAAIKQYFQKWED